MEPPTRSLSSPGGLSQYKTENLTNLTIEELKRSIKSKITAIATMKGGREKLQRSFSNSKLNSASVLNSYQTKFTNSINFVNEEIDLLKNCYYELLARYIAQCNSGTLDEQKEGFSGLARLLITNRGIDGDTISDVFVVSKDHSFEELSGITADLVNKKLKGNRAQQSQHCLILGKENHDLAMKYYHRMKYSENNYPYHERIAMFFYTLAKELDPFSCYDESHKQLLNYYCALANKELAGIFERSQLLFAERKRLKTDFRHPYEECFTEMIEHCRDPILLEKVAVWTENHTNSIGLASSQRKSEAAELRKQANKLTSDQK